MGSDSDTRRLESIVIDGVCLNRGERHGSSGEARAVLLIPRPQESELGIVEVWVDVATWLEKSYVHPLLLNKMAAFLFKLADSDRYRKGMAVGGMLYLQDMTENEDLKGTSRKCCQFFSRICGDEAMKKVVLLTTRWPDVPKDGLTNAYTRATELKEGDWAELIAKKARLCHLQPPEWLFREEERSDNACEIIRGLVGVPGEEIISGHAFIIERVQAALKDLVKQARKLRSSARKRAPSEV
jgi:hypothetical protein